MSLCSTTCTVSPHPEFPKSCSYSPGVTDMTEGLAMGQLAQLKGVVAVVATIWLKDMLSGSLCCSCGLLFFFLFMWHVVFSVFILPLVCQRVNCVRCFISTFFLYPASEPGLLGNMGWAQKTLTCLPKCHFLNLRREEKRKIKKRDHFTTGTAMFCDFHHIYKVDISEMIGATAEVVVQKSWQVVLEETLRGHHVQTFTYTDQKPEASMHSPAWIPSLWIQSYPNTKKRQTFKWMMCSSNPLIHCIIWPSPGK